MGLVEKWSALIASRTYKFGAATFAAIGVVTAIGKEDISLRYNLVCKESLSILMPQMCHSNGSKCFLVRPCLP